MKQFKLFSTFIIASGLLFNFSSCNSGEEKKTDEKPADTVAVKAPEPAAPVKPGNLMVIMHKVSSYAKWKPLYEAHDSVRQSFGLHNFVLARGVKDTNMVMVVLKMDDTAKAKQFMALPGLKATMQKGGVVGEPTVSMLDVQMQDTTANTQSIRLLVTHKVKDWDTWKKEFDSHKQARMDAGLSDRVLAYNAGDNHMVSIVFLVNDIKKADAFSQSADLKQKMEKAGVEGPPTFFYYTIAQKY